MLVFNRNTLRDHMSSESRSLLDALWFHLLQSHEVSDGDTSIV